MPRTHTIPVSWTLALAGTLVLCACPSKSGSTETTTPGETTTPSSEAQASPKPQPTFVQNRGEYEGLIVAQIPPTWTLVPVEGGGVLPLRDGLAVALQPEGLFLGNELLVPAVDGRLLASAVDRHLILALHERAEQLAPALQGDAELRGEEWDRHVNLYLHPEVRFGDLVDTMYTLGQAGFAEYQFAVASRDAAGLVTHGLDISPPKYAPLPAGGEPPPKPADFRVYLAERALYVARRPAGAVSNEMIDELAWDDTTMAKLEAHAKAEAAAMRATDVPARVVVASADNSMPFASLATALATVIGTRCDAADLLEFEGANPLDCHLQMIIIEAGSG